MAQQITKYELLKKTKAELLDLAEELGIAGHQKLNKSELMMAILNRMDQSKDNSLPTQPQQSFFSKYSNHIYGLASLIGLVLAVIAFLPKDQTQKTPTTTAATRTKTTNPDILPTEILEKKVAVMIFDDESGESGLSSLGLMISDWITNGLMDINRGNVVSAANVRNNVAFASIGGGAQPSFAEATGAEVLIQGRYYLVEDQVHIHSNIVDATSGSVIQSLAPISGPKDQVMDLVDELTQRLLGFWATSKQKRHHRRPPKYRAYRTFVEAYDTYRYNDEVTEKKFLEAYSYDSTYFEPLLGLLPMYANNGMRGKGRQLIDRIEELNPDFTEYEKLRFKSIKAGYDRNYIEQIELYEQMAEVYPGQAYNAGFLNIRLNRPARALHYIERKLKNEGDNETYWDQASESRKLEALYHLGRYDDIISYSDSLQLNCKNEQYAAFHMLALAAKGDWDTFDQYHSKYKRIVPLSFPAISIVCCYMHNHDMPQLDNYIDDMYEEIQILPKDHLGIVPNLTGYYYMKGDFEKSYGYTSRYSFLFGRSAHELVKMGQVDRAQELMALHAKDQLGRDKGNALYQEAIYFTALDQKDKALDALKDAFDNGYLFYAPGYGLDPYLKDLHGYPPFDEFIKPKG